MWKYISLKYTSVYYLPRRDPDDVADTGATLELVRDFCADKVAEVRCAVIYQKPRSLVDCEYVWRHTDRWINFPWSVLPPVVAREPRVVDA